MSDHDFESDSYGHGECKHCGKVEALHGDVIANARAEGERTATERIVQIVKRAPNVMSNPREQSLVEAFRSIIIAAIERGEHNG